MAGKKTRRDVTAVERDKKKELELLKNAGMTQKNRPQWIWTAFDKDASVDGRVKGNAAVTFEHLGEPHGTENDALIFYNPKYYISAVPKRKNKMGINCNYKGLERRARSQRMAQSKKETFNQTLPPLSKLKGQFRLSVFEYQHLQKAVYLRKSGQWEVR